MTPVAMGPAFAKRSRVVEVLSLVEQVVGAGVSPLALGSGQDPPGGAAADGAGDQAGLATQHRQGLGPHPLLGAGITFVVQAPGGLPKVLQNMNEVDQDRDLHHAPSGLSPDQVELMVVAVHQRHPPPPVLRITALGLVEEPGHHGDGILDDRRRHPLPPGSRGTGSMS